MVRAKHCLTFCFLLITLLFIIAYVFMPSKPTFRHIADVTHYLIYPDHEKAFIGLKLRKHRMDLLELKRQLGTPFHFSVLQKKIEDIEKILQLLEQKIIHNISRSDSNSKLEKDVCPEKFDGLRYNNIACKVPIHKLVTLLIYAPEQYQKPAMSYQEIMQNIENLYQGVKVILATHKSLSTSVSSKISKLKIKFRNEVYRFSNEGTMWSKLLDQVDTPYVLVAPRITHFDDDINLHRLVQILSNRDDVAIAGGSYRNLTGHWDLGCRQESFNYWTAQYSSGYYRSFNECVVCDYLPGPFVAKTKLLKEVTFDSSLSHGVFYDLFWRLKHLSPAGNLAVVCADIMFNIDNHQKITDGELAPFADKHNIKKMITPDGAVHWFGCKRGLSHTKGKICSWSDGIGVPPCDLDNLADVIKFTMTTCEEHNIICEYAAGTVLGAVKFGSVIPWEKDADIHFHTNNYSAVEKLKGKFEAAGFRFKANPSGLGTFDVDTIRWSLAMYGRKTLEVGDMLAQNKFPTRVPIAGAWVTTPRNPGLFSRNHYVHEYFRHAEHHGGNLFYVAGAFKTCPTFGHSACLDQYPADGNMQFLPYLP